MRCQGGKLELEGSANRASCWRCGPLPTPGERTSSTADHEVSAKSVKESCASLAPIAPSFSLSSFRTTRRTAIRVHIFIIGLLLQTGNLSRGNPSYRSPITHDPHDTARPDHLDQLSLMSAHHSSAHSDHPTQTYLLQPTEQHAHASSTPGIPSKIPTPTLRKAARSLRRHVPLPLLARLSRSLRHALVQVLHQCIAQFRAIARAVVES